MIENPYKYKGPLDPATNNLVCVPRTSDVKKVTEGIARGDYWAILGPRQIGKTTFLHLLQHQFGNAHYLYFDFELPTGSDDNLYQLLFDRFLEKIPSEQKKNDFINGQSLPPALRFFHFLEKFKPRDNKKIILLFDEIDSLPAINDFLHLWRKVNHERYHNQSLYRYNVIVTGAKDLISLTLGPNSPFNVAEILYIKDFSAEESRQLIERPFEEFGITIEENGIEELLEQTSGHPQMLQHACYLLVETARLSSRKISQRDVRDALEILFVGNTNLITLAHDLKDEELRHFVKDIRSGKKKKFHPYKQFSLFGAGPICEKNSFCVIRNKIYEKLIDDKFGNFPSSNSHNMDKSIRQIKKEKEMTDVLFLYSNLDKKEVEIIGEKLMERGINPRIELPLIQPGRSYKDSISHLMPGIKSIALFIGPTGSKPWEDDYKERILTQAVQKQIPIIPIILPDVDSEPELPDYLKHLTFVRFDSITRNKQALDALEYGITGESPKE